MTIFIPEIRNNARALIVKGQSVLLLKKTGGELGLRYALPGGGQEVGESLQEAIQRECLEEIGSRVEIGDLLHVADFYKNKATSPPARKHLVEFIFRCQIDDSYEPQMGPHPDKHQIDVVWIELDKVADLTFSPYYLAYCVKAIGHTASPSHYLGAFHDHPAP